MMAEDTALHSARWKAFLEHAPTLSCEKLDGYEVCVTPDRDAATPR